MNPLASTSGFERLRLRATLLSHYELPWLGVNDDLAEQVGPLLFHESVRVRTGDGYRHWRLNDIARRSVVRDFTFTQLRSAWSQIEHRPDDDRQWAIDQYVGEARPVDLDGLGLPRLRALAWLARWLGGAAPHVPDVADVTRHLGFSELLDPFRSLVGENFVGREAILHTLRGHLTSRTGPVLLYGIGGVGKSALALRHLLSAAEDGGALVSYLNFDQSALDPGEPVSLVAAIARQLTVQVRDGGAARLASECHRRLRDGARARAAGDHGRAVREQSLDLVPELASIVRDRPLVVVFDTFEEVQRRDLPVQREFARFLAALWDQVPLPSFVLAGRSPAPDLELRQIHLTGLSTADAVDLLRRLLPGQLDLRQAHEILDLVGTSPLSVHLAAGVVRTGPREAALRDIALHRGAVDGELYRRLLGHIKDADIRRIAHPGLTLRRITPDLIRRVLAQPCRVDVPDDAAAEEVFDRFAKEAMLVTRAPNEAVVVHRSDVRRMMLSRLAADTPQVVARIHRAAVRYYRERDGAQARAEELYHRLMLGHRSATLDPRWDDAALPYLISSLDELPPASKAYLAAKSPALAVSEEELRQADAEVRRHLVVRRATKLVAAGSAADALADLDAHIRQTGDRSALVLGLRVSALEQLHRYEEALGAAQEGRDNFARRNAVKDFAAFTVHVARLLERVGRPIEAKRRLTDTLIQCRLLPPTPPNLLGRLGLIMCLLQLRRVGMPMGELRTEQLRAEAVTTADQLRISELAAVPGLLRDLAAEAGEQSPRLLRAALRSIGLATFEAEIVTSTLEDDAAPGPSGRIEHGLRVSGLLDAAEEIGSASRIVSEAYQSEAELTLYRESDRGRLPRPHATVPVDEFGGRDRVGTAPAVMDWEVLPWHRSPGLPAEILRKAREAAAAGNTTVAARLLNQALDATAEMPPTATTAELKAAVLVTLGQVSIEGEPVSEGLARLETATRHLDHAQPGARRRALEGSIQAQTAQVLHRAGNTADALPHYDAAVYLTEDSTPSSQAQLPAILLNRGLAHLALRDTRRAGQDLERCARLAGDRGLLALGGHAHQSLGDLAQLIGDLPGALDHYRESERVFQAVAPQRIARVRLDQAKALMKAGLLVEAEHQLREVIPALRKQGAGHDLAEAELALAAATLLSGRYEEARRHAAAAQRRFARRGNHPWAEIASLTRMRADTEARLRNRLVRGVSPEKSQELARRLESLGLTDEAVTARALGARLAIARGALDVAAAMLGEIPTVPDATTPIDERMLVRLCRAEFAVASGNRGQALREARAGMADLSRVRDHMGGLDLLSGTAVHGRELGELAIRLALADRSPRKVFRWLEQTRAQVYRYQPLTPIDDPALAESITELRSLTRARQQARVAKQTTTDLDARLTVLQRQLAQGYYTVSWGRPRPVAAITEVFALLGDRALVYFAQSGDTLSAIVLVDGRTRLVELGSLTAVEELVRQLHADLDALAPSSLIRPLVEVVTRSATHRAEALDRMLLAPLEKIIADRELVIIPTGYLYALAWGTLTSLRDCPVVVAPSATSWVTAERSTPSAGERSVVLVAGPDLFNEYGELPRLAELHRRAVVLSGVDATVANTLAAMDGAHLVHIAAHGNHEPENAMFSRLELADGPLFAHEVMRLSHPPAQIVLAAGALALSHIRPGDEALGFAGALLASGSRTVVGSVCQLGEEVTATSMTELHTLLAAGVPMAAALARIVGEDPLRRPFVCIGSG